MPDMREKNFMVLVDQVRRMIDGDMRKPLIVSVMGQTGVGKSSLINALFGTDLPTDPVRPGTTKVEPVPRVGKANHDVIFYDLPGVGESTEADQKWVPEYRQRLRESDVAIWAVLAESRSFKYDLNTLNSLIENLKHEEKVNLLSKIVFVLTKVDLLTDLANPGHWFLVEDKNEEGFFVPDPSLKGLIERKADYFREAFISPFKPLIRGQTYSKGSLNGKIPAVHSEEGIVYYDGFLEEAKFVELSRLHPKYKNILRRLYESYRVVPCSAHLRYNLDLLMNVIISRLNTHSAGRFKGFVENKRMDRMPYSEAKLFTNIVPFNGPESPR